MSISSDQSETTSNPETHLESMENKYVAVLSDKLIRKEIAAGNIVLYDPDRDCFNNIQNCSIDVTLGPYFYRNDKTIPFFNPWNIRHVHDYWGTVKKAAIITSDDILDGRAQAMALKEGDEYILIQPGESILAHTREFIGGLNHITTMMKARSSMGRSNVTICRDAGWGDISYYNRWTLEITNNGTSPVVLPVGSRVGQLVFLYTGIPDSIYSGKYQTGSNLQEIVKGWNPTMLLPKLHTEK